MINVLLGVSSKSIPELRKKLSLESIRDVPGLPMGYINQCRDDVTQSRETTVDASGLLQPHSAGVRVTLTLAAGQVYQVELRHADVGHAGFFLLL